MNNKRLSIKIKCLPKDIFEFTLNPKNTPAWIKFIKSETSNEYPTKLGTVYKNISNTGTVGEYIVTILEKNKVFEFTSKDGNYHVEYTFTPISNDTTEMEYFEWVEHGELTDPFPFEPLEKLKELLEHDR